MSLSSQTIAGDRPAAELRTPTNAKQTQDLESIVRPEYGAVDDAYRRYSSPLCNIVERNLGWRLRRRVDPEEVVHTAFLGLCEAMASGKVRIGPGGVSWTQILRFTINRINKQIEYNTQQKRDPMKEVYAEGDDLPTRSEDRAEFVALADVLSLALKRLSPSDGVVLLLRVMEFDEGAIATILGTTRDRIKHVRDKIRRTLGDFRDEL